MITNDELIGLGFVRLIDTVEPSRPLIWVYVYYWASMYILTLCELEKTLIKFKLVHLVH